MSTPLVQTGFQEEKDKTDKIIPMGARLLKENKEIIGNLEYFSVWSVDGGNKLMVREKDRGVWIKSNNSEFPTEFTESHQPDAGHLWSLDISTDEQKREMARGLGRRTIGVELASGKYYIQPDGQNGFANYPKNR